ncbi:co-chaperone DjlA [Teredinibacter franksiae]|jgi:DnaJ-domain-containing proteins 1|uniref:co-chaperone DjlA n=1 Tax=Teredinibacter franksiae TaxID=2761453 RepID=UPI001624ACCF|nr:co-chaperone DjlA [Teredinibacter franksiae]
MFGKVIAGLIGFVTLGPLGLLIGVFVGHLFDKGRQGLRGQFDPQRRAEIENAFFSAVFPLLGYIAKADGRVSQDEISGTEQLMVKMNLSVESRQRAIQLFKQGTEAGFSLDATVEEFVTHCGRYNDLKQILLVYLISLAFADGHLHEEEERILAQIASDLGYSRYAFNHLIGMVKAQSFFHRSRQSGGGQQSWGGQQGPSANELELAYEALGVKASATDAELKRAYRKLMSEFHPDKLAGRGVPENMVKVATERTQEIQTAYDLIKKYRKA